MCVREVCDGSYGLAYRGYFLIAAFTLAIVPYLLVHGPVNRLARLLWKKRSHDARGIPCLADRISCFFMSTMSASVILVVGVKNDCESLTSLAWLVLHSLGRVEVVTAAITLDRYRTDLKGSTQT